jgi:hypothetical protein
MVESEEKQVRVAIVAGYLELVMWNFRASSRNMYIGFQMHCMY